MKRKILFTFCLIVLITIRAFSQETWLPFLEQTKTAPTVNVSSSNNNTVSFSVQINGMSVSQKIVDSTTYQSITIPGEGLTRIAGSPEVPVITKLVAIPDCDNVTISISPSGQLEFSNYYVIPAPGYQKKYFQDGSHDMIGVYEVNNSVYSSNASFPGKNGEIIETGYIRSQKVVRIALYPVQFNPMSKTITAFTNINVTLSFVNPTSAVNKELGIFNNMMHHAALNYVPESLSSSTQITDTSPGDVISKAPLKRVAASTSGSVTWISDLTTLVGTNAIPVDYLIITHSSLFNSAALSTLANYRYAHNGFDVAIVQVDGSGQSGIYNVQSNGQIKYPSTSSTRYLSVRNFIADIYNNGIANHTGDGHLAYLLLAGDAYLDDFKTQMVPAAYPTYQTQSAFETVAGDCDSAADYYYACLTQSGGNYDDLQDIMYGRISVGDATKLSNVVNKIINYETNTGNWQENYAFVSGSPDKWDQPYNLSDLAISAMTNIIPSNLSIGYSYRNYTTDPPTSVTGANVSIFPQSFTLNDYLGIKPFPQNDPYSWCGWDQLNYWLYNQLNSNNIHTFVYEGHGGWNALVANEGSGRHIFYLTGTNGNSNDPTDTASLNYKIRNTFNTFMILNCCDAGHFDNGGGIWLDHTGNCLAEQVVYDATYAAIGCLASTRDSFSFAFGVVDQDILAAQYSNLSFIMGEAVMESKLNLSTGQNNEDLLCRRQFNLYGDPALNLWPTTNNINHNTILSGTNNILSNLTVAPGVTLTICSGATINFSAGAKLTVNGTLSATGTSTSPICFNFISPNSTTQNGIIFNSGSSGNISYCKVTNAYRGIFDSIANVNVSNSSISQCSIGLYLYNSSPVITSCSIDTNSIWGIYALSNSSPSLSDNYILNNGYGIFCSTSSNPTIGNGISGGGNNISNNTYGIFCQNNSIPKIGNTSPVTGGYNNLVNTTYNVYNMSANSVYAENNWWGTTNPSNFKIAGESSVAANPYLPSSATISNPPPLNKAAANPYASQSSTSTLLNQLNQANQMIAANDLDGAKTICLNMISSYPDSSFSFNALNLLKGLYPDVDSVKYVYQSFFNNNQKKDLYAMAGLILAEVDTLNKLSHINDVINSYGQDNVVQCALFDKFVYYHFEKGDKQNALAVLNKLDNMFPMGSEDIEAHIILGDTAYYKMALAKKPVIQGVSVQLPTVYKLFDNYPNPFNPSTVIQYQIPINWMVTLKVFDVLGREIRTLVHEYKTAGSYSVSFDASKLASGVYIYQLKAGNFVSTKKMMYLK